MVNKAVPDQARNVALDVNQSGVDVVDMNAMTHGLCERIGRDEAHKFYAISTGIEFSRDGEPSKDVTHPIPAGAQAYSQLFIDEIRRRRLPVCGLFR